MAKKFCIVELDANDQVVRIFRTLVESSKAAVWALALRTEAVAAIRKQIFKRSGGQCEYCGKFINGKFHLHEKIHRSRGGEISLENSVALCADCHIGPTGEHGSRRPQFSKTLL
jgi:5-methylcytosine-specific restriction endonuclease McrA